MWVYLVSAYCFDFWSRALFSGLEQSPHVRRFISAYVSSSSSVSGARRGDARRLGDLALGFMISSSIFPFSSMDLSYFELYACIMNLLYRLPHLSVDLEEATGGDARRIGDSALGFLICSFISPLVPCI